MRIKDITVKIIGQNEGLDEFIKNAKDMVKSKSYAYGGQSGYGGYYNQGYRGLRQVLRTIRLRVSPTTRRTVRKKKNKDKSSGKKNEGEKPRTRIGAGWHGQNACQESMNGWEDEDDYDPYAYLGR